jgi:outer membrane receptor protein involved in Fe transport
MGIARCAGLILILLTLRTETGLAQGVQTGTLSGSVSTSDGLRMPGVTVTVTSPALQGVRTAVTDANGNYVIPALPPGSYEVTFEAGGMTTRTEKTILEVGRVTTLTTTLTVGGVSENVVVVGDVPTAGLTSVEIGAHYTQSVINTLPTSRTLFGIAELAPGLTTNTPNGSQVTIAGAFAYDSVFMVDGVDVNDNLFANPNSLFIEDAIQETTILTSGITAEYGRFTGGVINAITKSGSNRFAGTFRMNFSNPAWTDETPFEKEQTRTRPSVLGQNYEGTFGGPIKRDRVWFFAAGRWQDSTTSSTLPDTNQPFDQVTENRRFTLKANATLKQNHTLQGNYTRNGTDQTRVPFGFTIDTHAAEHPSFPNDLIGASYSGVFGPSLLVNGQVSSQRFGFRDTGGTSANIVESPFISLGRAPGVTATRHYNAPYFDAGDPEDRDNFQVAGSLTAFLATRWGSHNVKGGFEHFTSTRVGGNSQSATGYVFDSDYATANNAPALDANGYVIPTFVPFVTILENWLPTKGAKMDIRTLSLYVQDGWLIGPQWSLHLGVRYENVRSDATGGIVSVDTQTIVPRLAVSFDPTKKGDTVFQGSYAHYAGRYNEAQIGLNTSVANPAVLYSFYSGPLGQGRDFAPGFNPANYSIPAGANFPTENVEFDSGLSSPLTKEVTFSAGQQLGNRGFAKITYTKRWYTNFIEDFLDDPTASGKVPVVFDGVDYGEVDNQFFVNSNVPRREYQGLLLQANYRFWPRLSVEGHWTIQLENNGNFEGENPNQPALTSIFGDYPELLPASRYYPAGRLNDFQRHKVRLWAIYRQELGRFGALDIAPLARIESGLTYSLAAANVPLNATQLARNPGYILSAIPGTGVPALFFDDRGTEFFKGFALVDLSLNYSIPIVRTLSPWFKVDVYNLTNNQKLIRWNTTVTRNLTGPVDAFGLPTTFNRGANFGKGTSTAHYPGWRAGQTGGRTFLFSAGIRF